MALITAVGDRAGRDLQRREQGGRAVALVVVRGPLWQAGPDRKDRLCAVQRLDLGFLIDAQHNRVGGRVEVKPDDIADLRLELGIGGELKRPLSPRLHPIRAPRSGDRRVGDPEMTTE